MAQAGRNPSQPRNARRIPLPAAAFDEWLAEIDDAAELKVTLRVAALLALEPNRRGVPPSLPLDDLLDDPVLKRAAYLGDDHSIRTGVARAMFRGTLTGARIGGEIRLLLSGSECREYVEKTNATLLKPEQIAEKHALPDDTVPVAPSATPTTARDNIFALYERHIGTYGHGTAEQLRAAEEEFQPRWIEEAFAIADAQNVRSWRYVHAILQRWRQEGKPGDPHAATGRGIERPNDNGKPGNNPAPDSRTGYLDSYRRRHGRLPWESDEPESAAGR